MATQRSSGAWMKYTWAGIECTQFLYRPSVPDCFYLDTTNCRPSVSLPTPSSLSLLDIYYQVTRSNRYGRMHNASLNIFLVLKTWHASSRCLVHKYQTLSSFEQEINGCLFVCLINCGGTRERCDLSFTAHSLRVLVQLNAVLTALSVCAVCPEPLRAGHAQLRFVDSLVTHETVYFVHTSC